MKNNEYKIKSVVIGHALGDAFGVPIEFCEREKLEENPVSEMLGFGSYPVPAGAWSDDTSMTLAALDSLSKGEVDYDEIMENFVRWCSEDAYTPTDEMFDIGRTCLTAIRNYLATDGKPALECGLTDERSNGNGSLMRIHPFSLMAYFSNMKDDFETLIDNASAMTHAHERSKLACRIYTKVLFETLDTQNKTAIKRALEKAKEKYKNSPEISHYSRLFSPDFEKLEKKEIKSTGYVVDTLEAALWCVLTTDTYRDCIIKAANLGDDTDTVAAVAGGIAGALYGYTAFPPEWLKTLLKRDYIEQLCEKFSLSCSCR